MLKKTKSKKNCGAKLQVRWNGCCAKKVEYSAQPKKIELRKSVKNT